MSHEDGFESFDRNGNGQFSKSDFEETVADLQLPLDAPLVASLFAFMDTNHSGTVDLAKWRIALRNADTKEAEKQLLDRGTLPP